jgi:hypothetical protein
MLQKLGKLWSDELFFARVIAQLPTKFLLIESILMRCYSLEVNLPQEKQNLLKLPRYDGEN